MRLNVNYGGRRVGQILEKEGVHFFQYDVRFISDPLPLSPLELPVTRAVTRHERRAFAGLPGLIFDSLPDGFGMSVIREHFRDKGAPPPSPLQILSYLGERTMGALTYSPPDGDAEQQKSIDLVNAALSARKLVEMDHGSILDPALVQAGGTAGGIQPKILASISADGEIVTGANDVPEGMSPWIIKLNTEGHRQSAYAPLEFAYFQMARDCGIHVPETALLTDSNGVKHFAIKRFDRDTEDPNLRIHTHSYAGIAGVDYQSLSGSYDHLLQTTYELTRSYKELKEQVLRAVFNVISHNHDDHAKNFAFQMDAIGVWRLAPAYDLSMSVNQTRGNWLSLNGSRMATAKDFHAVVERYRIAQRFVDDSIARVQEVVKRWPEYAKTAGVSVALTEEVERQLVPVIRRFA
ncbi:MAG: hypothetical protein GVY36_02305 [Verrucomicrobia bacterium]|jgi:serine/threonine-protein kinase HipA|nr:hypothetical protein [Verrucomicrobiota bacterium]